MIYLVLWLNSGDGIFQSKFHIGVQFIAAIKVHLYEACQLMVQTKQHILHDVWVSPY